MRYDLPFTYHLGKAKVPSVAYNTYSIHVLVLGHLQSTTCDHGRNHEDGRYEHNIRGLLVRVVFLFLEHTTHFLSFSFSNFSTADCCCSTVMHLENFLELPKDD